MAEPADHERTGASLLAATGLLAAVVIGSFWTALAVTAGSISISPMPAPLTKMTWLRV